MESVPLSVTYDLSGNDAGNLLGSWYHTSSLGRAALCFQHAEEFANEFVVPKSAFGFAQHRLFGLSGWECRLIRTSRGERIEDIYYLENSR